MLNIINQYLKDYGYKTTVCECVFEPMQISVAWLDYIMVDFNYNLRVTIHNSKSILSIRVQGLEPHHIDLNNPDAVQELLDYLKELKVCLSNHNTTMSIMSAV